MNIQQAKNEAKHKALDSLARYKFMMFGYHAALWVTLNRLDTHSQQNPFATLVNLARQMERREDGNP